MSESIVQAVGKPVIKRVKRVATGNVATNSGTNVTVIWDTPFSSTDYSVVVELVSDHAGDGLGVMRIRSKTPTQCVIHLWNKALTTLNGELQVIGIAD